MLASTHPLAEITKKVNESKSYFFNLNSIPAIIGKIDLPTPYPNGVDFGGPNYETMYITTTRLNVDFYTNEIGTPAKRPAGDLLVIDGLGVTGTPSYRPAL